MIIVSVMLVAIVVVLITSPRTRSLAEEERLLRELNLAQFNAMSLSLEREAMRHAEAIARGEKSFYAA